MAVVQLEKSLLFRFSLLQFYDAVKARKKPSLKQTEQQELKSVSNLPAKIDIDALKSFTKSRTINETEYRQKVKTASLDSRFTGYKKEECTSTCSLLKNFET